MKPLRIALVATAVLFSLLVVVVLLAFTSAVQTWAARRVLASSPELQGEVGKVDVGLKRTYVENLRLRQPGMVLTVPSATVDVSLWDAVGKRVRIQKLVAKGWELDLTTPRPPAADLSGEPSSPGDPPATPLAAIGFAQVAPGTAPRQETSGNTFPGVFKSLELPVDLELHAAELEGQVVFAPNPAQAPARAHVQLTGGKLAPGSTAEFMSK